MCPLPLWSSRPCQAGLGTLCGHSPAPTLSSVTQAQLLMVCVHGVGSQGFWFSRDIEAAGEGSTAASSANAEGCKRLPGPGLQSWGRGFCRETQPWQRGGTSFSGPG